MMCTNSVTFAMLELKYKKTCYQQIAGLIISIRTEIAVG
jgi:hypothetical protein